LAVRPGDLVLEVGAGAGFLTERLLGAGARVLAVEIDPVLVKMLKHSIGFSPRLKIIEADVLSLDLAGILDAENAGECLVTGNLPYHITSPILFHLFGCCHGAGEGGSRVARMVLMVQREVGIRMMAGPGGKEYGALSVAVAYRARCEKLFEVAPDAFLPKPRVRSAVMRLLPVRPSLRPDEEKGLFALTRAAFGQRRKMLANALAGIAGGKEAAERLLAECSMDPKRRGETLSLEEFRMLARAVAVDDR
jgi:16S rRNA (adenine1518-N6/adenine1519-N6)-dimethyltransferase